MRQRFNPQLTLGSTPIKDVVIPTKTRSHMARLMATLQYIYVNPRWRDQIFDLLSEKLLKGKKVTGRNGMSLWEIFVLSQVRLCLSLPYDELHHQSNYDTLLRGILGVLPTDYTSGKEYEYHNIYDNIRLLDSGLLQSINEVVVAVGHEVLKKKKPLRIKTDSFVVKTDTHFPTDYNLLWDSARKCISLIEKFPVNGWRKSKDWHRALKNLMRSVGQISRAGGQNKADRLEIVVSAYLQKARALSKKVDKILRNPTCISEESMVLLMQLEYFREMLLKHIDLLDRRLLQKETIPHQENVFSVFQPYTEWIKKGKLHPNVEIGKKLFVTSDQYHLIVDWQVGEKQADNQLTLSIAKRLQSKYAIQSLNVDRGFSDQADKALLEAFIPEVIMPKKGRLTQKDKALKSTPSFKRLKNKHSAIESNIHEVQHRGLSRCPDRTEKSFHRYVGLAITAYNLHKIGQALQAQKRAKEKQQAASRQAA